MIILDIGEGSVLDDESAASVIGEIAQECGFPPEEIVVKPQLFEYEPPNRPLDHGTFDRIYREARAWGLACTASVFDKSSLEFLLRYEVPFVKIANRPYLRKFIDLIPRGIPVYASFGRDDIIRADHLIDVKEWLCCISHYPTESGLYEESFEEEDLAGGVSDHTVGLDLFKAYYPQVYEKHFGLKGAKGPSLGPWSIDEDGLRELLALAKDVSDD